MRTRSSVLVLSLSFTAACASTGATFGSGVGDAFPTAAPYYAGAASTPAAVSGARVGILPIHFQPSAGQPAIFDPKWGAGSPLVALLGEMNAYLDSIAMQSGTKPIRLEVASSGAAATPAAMGIAPDVRFGCRTELDLPGSDCAAPEGGALGRGRVEMKLAVGRPDAKWVTNTAAALDRSTATHAIVVTLEISQYPLKQRGLAGKKVVELGTDHEVELPWLTSLETPVTVLQLTGALVDRAGKAVRIGAEGIVARRTPLLVSAIGGEVMLTDADIALVRTTKRSDVTGQPLAWQLALRTLVAKLTP